MAPLLNQPRRPEPKPPTGVLTMAAEGTVRIKLCWRVPGDLTALVHALRDKQIVDPKAVWAEALAQGFDELLLLTKDGRITADGKNEEPPEKQPDPARLGFSDSDSNPFGRGTALYLDMSAEFVAAQRKADAAERKSRR